METRSCGLCSILKKLVEYLGSTETSPRNPPIVMPQTSLAAAECVRLASVGRIWCWYLPIRGLHTL